MDEMTRQRVLEKKEKYIDMVIERAKRDFEDDIAIIGLTGSFSTGDFHEKSDIDLIIINNTERGWEMSYCFIWDDIGYDIYCTPWETRIMAQSNMESPMVSCLVDLQILYCSKPEYMDKFNAYKEKALDALAKPIGKECIERAKQNIDVARQEYAGVMLSDDIGTVRYAACGVLYNLINGIVNMNNTYIRRGVKRYLEDLLTYRYIPDDFESLYMAVVRAGTVEEIREASLDLLKSVVRLYDKMHGDFVEKPSPTYENLKGTYEELWCNCRNKVMASVEANDAVYAYHAAMGAQNYLDEMTELFGTKKFDLMRHFDADNLYLFKDAFLQAMAEYLTEYDKVGRKVERYDSFEDLYAYYMK